MGPERTSPPHRAYLRHAHCRQPSTNCPAPYRVCLAIQQHLARSSQTPKKICNRSARNSFIERVLFGNIFFEVTQSYPAPDRKSTRLNSSHTVISYAVFCLKKKTAHSRTLTILNPRP